jgi:hypothetical protein
MLWLTTMALDRTMCFRYRHHHRRFNLPPHLIFPGPLAPDAESVSKRLILQMKLKESEVERHRGVQEANSKYQMSMANKCNITLLTYSCFHIYAENVRKMSPCSAWRSPKVTSLPLNTFTLLTISLYTSKWHNSGCDAKLRGRVNHQTAETFVTLSA